MNKVILVGRFVSTPELRTFSMDKLTTDFTLAVDSGYRTSTNEKITEFIDCQAYGKSAEFICKYFSKGDPALIEGRITVQSYKKEEEYKKYVKVLVEKIEFTYGGKNSNSVEAENERHKLESSQTGLEFKAVPKSDKGEKKQDFGVYDDVLGF